MTISVLLMLALPLASPAPCKYEQNCHCAAPGITNRWRAAHCMIRVGTDDYLQADVQACLHAPEPKAMKKMDACAKNAYWKASICRSLHKDAKAAEKCIRDRAYVPRVVKEGV